MTHPLPSVLSRTAGAPISWGVCEAPGWGIQLPPERVLAEAASLGLRTFEQGALGWLPSDPEAQRALTGPLGIQIIGGFVPLVLQHPERRAEMVDHARRIAAGMAACGARYFVAAMVADLDRWWRPELDDAAWASIVEGITEVDAAVTAEGLRTVMHPHVDTLVEQAGEFERFCSDTEVAVCFDTGHLSIGGADVVDLVHRHHRRIGLVHLKDVDLAVAARLTAGELTLMTATQAGLFPPLGDGQVPLAEVLAALADVGYTGEFVVETDAAITGAPPAEGDGPIRNMARSLEFIARVDADLLAASR